MNWTGSTAVIVGSGPSAARTPLERARGRTKVIAVNSSWKLVPWADLLYACDSAWWLENNGATEFAGQRYTSSPMAAKRFGIELFIANGNNSGLRAIHLAERLGASPILLVGFDMHAQAGIHWHEPHRGKLHNPCTTEMKMWRTEMERVARKFAERNVKILNCTPGSELTCFPQAEFLEAIGDGDDDQVRADQSRHCAVCA